MSGLGSTRAAGLAGVRGFVVDVEAYVSQGLPSFVISGLGDASVAQSPGRILAAASTVGLQASQRRITMNLSPAGMRKVGPGFDLAIFVAVASAMGSVPRKVVRDVVHLGELGLDGSVRPVPGVLPSVHAAARDGARHVVVPVANAAEARLVSGVRVHPVADVAELLHRYRELGEGRPVREVPVPPVAEPADGGREKDLSDVLGQSEAKLALEVAAGGGHHLLLSGPPGAGKTMLAERLTGLLPELDDELAMEVTAIHSVLGALGDDVRLIRRPPFVAPHHGASPAAVIGGGTGRIRPGAITQAHGGVLFLDETPEFSKAVLQSLRTPLERGTVTVARANESVAFPARFQLVLAANPCPCGNGWGRGLDCTCSPLARRAYFGKLSGPLLDRVDLQVHVQPPGLALAGQPPGESSASVAARVAAARSAQRERWEGDGRAVRLNSHVPGSVLRERRWRLPGSDSRALDRALELGSISLRGYDRTLRVAWTVADIEGRQRPSREHVELALSFRRQNGTAA